MNVVLQQVLDARDGVATWSDAGAAASPGVVEWASRSGQVALAFPGVLTDPARSADDLRLRAALACAGPGAALSHTSALAVWRLPVDATGDIHVMAGHGRRIRVAGIVGHRRQGFVAEPPAARTRLGLRVTALETSLVDAWPLANGDAQRAPVIVAVAQRMTTPVRVRDALAAVSNLPHRQALWRLLGQLDAGCRSALELWGYEEVFTGPAFEGLRWQVPVRIGSRAIWLDAYDQTSATNFELDGAKFHSSPRDRERDLRRDTKLATMGIQTVRFTHHRLTHDRLAVQEESLAIMGVRRPAGLGPAV